MLQRQRARLDRHVSATFEQLARDHAVSLVAEGRLPADTIVGRWWRDETVEIDVLGLSGDRPVLVGEAQWRNELVARRDIQASSRRPAYLPNHGLDARLAIWAHRTGRSAPWPVGIRPRRHVLSRQSGRDGHVRDSSFPLVRFGGVVNQQGVMRASANLVPRTWIPGFLDSWDRGGAHRTSGAVRLLGRPAVRGRVAVTASHAGPADEGRYSDAGLATSNRIITTRTGRAGARQGPVPEMVGEL